jgi:hypothetical protein
VTEGNKPTAEFLKPPLGRGAQQSLTDAGHRGGLLKVAGIHLKGRTWK